MTVDLSLHQYLQSWNESLRQQKRAWPNRQELRRGLAEKAGRFLSLDRWNSGEIAMFSGGRPLVGVDGSVYTLGANYPFTLTAFQAVAKSTGKTGETDKIVLTSVFSPLEKNDREHLRIFMEEQEEGLSEEAAFTRMKDRRLALLEIEAALQAVERYHPFLLLLDGQFSRYQEDAELVDRWETLCVLARQKKFFVVGIVEEVGTMKLGKFLPQEVRERLMTGHDREILFGLLEPGEVFLPHEEIEIKRDAYVAFARLSDHPQAIACNFLPEQAPEAQTLMSLLYALTPKKGRGIPFWLDLVDVEARITRREWDMIVQASLDKDIYERFLRPQRDRRDY
jgi:hypothetical protein